MQGSINERATVSPCARTRTIRIEFLRDAGIAYNGRTDHPAADMTDLYFTTEELADLFGYASVQSVHCAISKGTFPVPTYRCGKRRVADREVVTAFFKYHREKGAKQLSENLLSENLLA